MFHSRGNQAYAKADFSRAEDCYTQGISCVSQNETSRSCFRALMLCYSNRAATRMSLGRLREALGDCLRASSIDPNFLRVQVRAARYGMLIPKQWSCCIMPCFCLLIQNQQPAISLLGSSKLKASFDPYLWNVFVVPC